MQAYRSLPQGWPGAFAAPPLAVPLIGGLARVDNGAAVAASASGGAAFLWTLDSWSPLSVAGAAQGLTGGGDGALASTAPSGGAATLCADDPSTARVDWLSCAPASQVVLTNATSLAASFRPLALGTYAFSLRASWALGGPGAGAAVSRLPCAEAVASAAVRVVCNRSPVAVGPGVLSIMRGPGNAFVPVVLSSAGSYDPDPEDAVLAIRWVLVSSPPGSALQPQGSPLPGWQSPRFVFTPDVDGAFVFALDVSDGCSSSQVR